MGSTAQFGCLLGKSAGTIWNRSSVITFRWCCSVSDPGFSATLFFIELSYIVFTNRMEGVWQAAANFYKTFAWRERRCRLNNKCVLDHADLAISHVKLLYEASDCTASVAVYGQQTSMQRFANNTRDWRALDHIASTQECLLTLRHKGDQRRYWRWGGSPRLSAREAGEEAYTSESEEGETDHRFLL